MQEPFIRALELHIKNLLEALTALIFSSTDSSNLEDSLIDDREVFKMIVLLIEENLRSDLEEVSVHWLVYICFYQTI